MSFELFTGDSLQVLKKFENATFDALITDPPAGISFLSKEWDSNKGGKENWIEWLGQILIECNRVLKPGALGLVWALPKTSHWTANAIDTSGFLIIDRITHVFSTGMPKSKNLGNGFGTGLKPAAEDWWLIRKPLEKGLSISDTYNIAGIGGLNINGCRIKNELNQLETEGRWPSNFIHDGCEEVLKLLPEVKGPWGKNGSHKSDGENSMFGLGGGENPANEIRGSESGSAARFFYCSKASKKDRNEGLEETEKNQHPTIKSTRLMRYLCKLVTPTAGKIIDPFSGTGSTGRGAVLEGFSFTGIDLYAENTETAEKRITWILQNLNEAKKKYAI